jgi:hypothetical protein
MKTQSAIHAKFIVNMNLSAHTAHLPRIEWRIGFHSSVVLLRQDEIWPRSDRSTQ